MAKFTFWSVFLAVLIAEIPCILRTTAMQIRTEGFASIIGGTLAANAVTLIFGILLAKFLVREIPSDYADIAQNIAAFVFIALGLMMISWPDAN